MPGRRRRITRRPISTPIPSSTPSARGPRAGSGPGYGGGSPTAIESNVPPTRGREPGGGIMPTPLPPSRPSGLGGVLSSAVQSRRLLPCSQPQPSPRRLRLAAPQSSMFTGIDRQNSGQTTGSEAAARALNLSGLLGGLFGGGGAAPSPAPPPPPARGTVGWSASPRQGPRHERDHLRPKRQPRVPGSRSFAPRLLPQNPTQLAATVGRARMVEGASMSSLSDLLSLGRWTRWADESRRAAFARPAVPRTRAKWTRRPRASDASYGSLAGAFVQPPYGGQVPSPPGADNIVNAFNRLEDTGKKGLLPARLLRMSPTI